MPSSGKSRRDSNFAKRRRQDERRRRQQLQKQPAAFGSAVISDAAAHRREIFLMYSRGLRPKEKQMKQFYKDDFPNIVIAASIIRRWIRLPF